MEILEYFFRLLSLPNTKHTNNLKTLIRPVPYSKKLPVQNHLKMSPKNLAKIQKAIKSVRMEDSKKSKDPNFGPSTSDGPYFITQNYIKYLVSDLSLSKK